MEQVEAILGLLLVALIGLALVSGLAIVVLIELAWIVRLGTRLYWRWRSSVQPSRVGREAELATREPDPVAQPNGTLPPDNSDGMHRGTRRGERPCDEKE
jgi:hypothetical protein